MKDEKLETLKAFFDLLTSSKCFSVAYDYLAKNGRSLLHVLAVSAI